MLSYSVKLGESNIKRDKIVWSEKYLSPDLSFVSGVTDQIYHLDKDMYVSASIGKDSNFSRLSVESTNVTRNGFVVVKGKKYRIKTTESPAIGQQGSVSYIEVNGVYYYLPNSGNTFTVKNQLKQEWKRVNGDYKVDIVEGDVTATVSGDFVKIDTVFWIENDTVNIDGYTYIFDKYDGGIKFYESGRSLLPNEVTPCDDITYNYFDNVSDYKYVTKFTLRKSEDKVIEFDRLSYCTYFYYVYYKDYYCPVKKSGNGYICQIPIRLLNGSDSQAMSSTTVTADTALPSRISQLKTCDSYVIIQGVKFPVDYAVQNANGGDEIAIYATDGTHNIGVGDKLTLSYYNPTGGNSMPVYSVDGKDFVMHDNCKYLLEPAIADTIKMEGIEYDVSYPNGKVDGKDALVSVDGEDIPMKIVDSKSKLERYGLVVTGDSQANTARYDIVSYDGVKIADKIYRVMVYETSPRSKYIVTDLPTTTEFIIESVEGSSLFICVPNFSRYEYDEAFINEMSANLCDLYVSNGNGVTVYSKNRAFGVREITPAIGKLMGTGSISSDDYYNLFNNLTLFTNSGYIQIDVPLTMDVANNAMQEDVVEKDFYETEKKKAINPIVDMEKDVYVPMFMKGKYSGSTTEFYQVTEINVNLHFRTRNLDSWKVNEGYNDISVSGTADNWFCTDFEPYKSMIESGNINDTDLILNTSDLMGLLFFDNDDVFYQKDNVAKSFLRFSYYDTPDPNTQSLLCTSTVFIDEHAMYDKYINNVRKNVNNYGLVEGAENIDNSETSSDATEFSGDVINRILVSTECLKGKYNARKKVYNTDDVDREVMKNDSKRVSSKFIIKNKYTTDTSSEGFYLYMFREYSENLHPKPIYMKVEFNHAGVGRTIPFIVPMKWKHSADNEYVPDRKLTFNSNDIEEFKKGYPLSYVYAQTYVPLYAVYDYKNKQYAYVFDDRYVVMEDNKVILNMFEIKIENETTNTVNARAQVRNNNVERARIDVNKRQFNSNI